MEYSRHQNSGSHPGIKAMEDATDAALAANQLAIQAEADQAAREQAVADRLNSPAAQVCNNRAELAVYGSDANGSDHDYDVLSLDADGNVIREIKFTVDEPLVGLQEIRSNPRFGKTQLERDKAANKYIADYENLQKKEGLSPAQAKLVMDMRIEDAQSMAEQVDARVRSGESRGNTKNPDGSINKGAKTLVKERYAKKDAKRLEKIKTYGILTREEYDSLTPGGSTGNVGNTVSTPEPSTIEKMEAVEFTDDQKNAMEAANQAAKEAREAYEDIKIRREGRAFNFKKGFRNKDMQAAYDKWMEAEQHAGAVVASAYSAHGFNMNTEIRGGNPDRELMKTLKGLGALMTIDAHTESIKSKIEETNDSLNKVTKKIAEIYANFGAVKPGQNPEDLSRKEKLGMFTKKAVKAAGLVAVGAGTALVLSPVLSGLAGVGAAGAVAGFGVSRVARGGLLAKIKRVSDSRLGVIRADEDRLAARAAIEANIAKSKALTPNLRSGTDIYKENSEKTVRKNQKRLLGGIALGAVGGALIEGLADDAWDGVKAGPGKVGDAAEWTGDKISGAWDEVTDWFDNNSPSESAGSNAGGDLEHEANSTGGNSLDVPGEGTGSIADQIVENPGGGGEAAGSVSDQIVENPVVGGEGQPDFVGNPEIADGQTNPGVGGVPGNGEMLNEVGSAFTVEAGNGVQTEINDALESWGYGRNDQLSAQLLQEASVKFPKGLVANNSTGSGWNELITAKGKNSWNPGVAEFLQQRAEEIISANPTIPAAG